MSGVKEVERVKLPVVISQDEAGFFVAEIPIIPGCFSQGKTRGEALANIKEAAELCLAGMKEEGWTLPKYFVENVEVDIS